MEIIRGQFDTGEEILWKETFPPENLLLSKRNDARFSNTFIAIGIGFAAFSFSLLFNSNAILYVFGPIFLSILFSYTGYSGLGGNRIKYDKLESWYGEAELRQYEKLILITNYHIFYKHPDVALFYEGELLEYRLVKYTKDIMRLNLTALSSIRYPMQYGGYINLSFNDPRMRYSDGDSFRLEIPEQARDAVIRALRVIKPLLRIVTYDIYSNSSRE